MIPTTSKRSLLILVADIKHNIKRLDVSQKEMYAIYTALHDLLGDLVLKNYNAHKKQKEV